MLAGGLDTSLAEDVAPQPIEYDAVFVYRFHPQKGVLELVDIWARVCQSLSGGRLFMIGNGGLERQLDDKVRRSGMPDNVILVGFQVGLGKARLLRRSRIVLHPSLYESGGRAAAEAIVYGLPGVTYNLFALRTYCPMGMLRLGIKTNSPATASSS